MGRFPVVCDCDHIGCCKPCPSCTALRARIEDVEGMAKAMNGGLEMHEECGSCEALRRKARAVSAWLKEG